MADQDYLGEAYVAVRVSLKELAQDLVVAKQDVASSVDGMSAESERIADAFAKAGLTIASAFLKGQDGADALSRTVRELIGADTIAAANQYALAVESIGGASKLTSGEQIRLLAVVNEAIGKYNTFGVSAPAALQNLQAELSAAVTATAALKDESARLAEQQRLASQQAAELAGKVRELSGQDQIAAAQQYAKAVEQIGGASKLTAEEKSRLNAQVTAALAKYKALGSEAPPVLQKLAADTAQIPKQTSLIQAGLARIGPAMVAAFSVAAIGTAISSYTDFTGKLVDLEAKTGISVTGLQRLKLAGQDAGVSLDTMSNASVALSKRLAEGKESVVGALGEVGIGYAQIRAQSPEAQLFQVGDAIGRITDQNEKIRLTNELFGKQGMELLPALNGKLEETAQAYERMGLVLDEDVVRQGDALGDQWTVLSTVGAALISSVLGPFVPALTAIATGLTHVMQWAGPVLKWTVEWGLMIKPLEIVLGNWHDTLVALGLAAQKQPKLHGDATKAVEEQTKAVRTRAAVPLEISLKEEEAAQKKLTTAAEASIEVHKKAAAAATDHAAALKRIDGRDAIEEGKKLIAVFNAAGGELGILPSQLESMRDQLKESAEAARLWGNVGLAKQFEDVAKRLDPLTVFQQRYNVKLNDFVYDANAAAHEANLLNIQLAELTGTMQQMSPLANSFSLEEMLATSAGGFRAPVLEHNPGVQLGTQILDGLESTLSGVPDVIADAFTGGGGISGALAAIGTQLATAITRPLMEAVGFFYGRAGQLASGLGATVAGAVGGQVDRTASMIGSLAGTIGGALVMNTALGTGLAMTIGSTAALGVATAGIGLAAVGAYYGLKKLFTIDPEIKKAREDVKKFEEAISDSLNAQQKAEGGGVRSQEVLIGVRDTYIALGMSMEEAAATANRVVAQMWDTDHPERSRAAIAEIGKAYELLAEQQKVVADGQERANGMFEELFAAAEDMGGTMPDAFRPLIDQMVELGLVTDDVAERLAGIGNEGEVPWEKMADAAEKYGISIDGLGGRFQAQRLGETAANIWKDFQMLTKGGADVWAVLAGMGDEIGQLVSDSLKFGVAIPENFKPLIEQLAASGQLVDDNGNKLTDLSGLKFGPPIEDQFERIANSMTELVAEIRAAVDALQSGIPRGAEAARRAVEAASAGMQNDLNDVYDAANGVTYGHSPGGFKEYPHMADKAATAIEDLADRSVAGLDSVYGRVEDVGDGLGSLPPLADSAARALVELGVATVASMGDAYSAIQRVLNASTLGRQGQYTPAVQGQIDSTEADIQRLRDQLDDIEDGSPIKALKSELADVERQIRAGVVDTRDEARLEARRTALEDQISAETRRLEELRAAIDQDIRALETRLQELRRQRNPFEGFPTPPEMISPEQAIARINDVFRQFAGRDATGADLGAIAQLLFPEGFHGQPVDRLRLENLLVALVEQFLTVRYAQPDLPNLPAFGEGGVVTERMLAVVGEVPEAIIPLDRLAALQRGAVADVGMVDMFERLAGRFDQRTRSILYENRQVMFKGMRDIVRGGGAR